MLPVLTHPLYSSCAGQVSMETASSSARQLPLQQPPRLATRPTSLSLICPLLPKHLTAGEYSVSHCCTGSILCIDSTGKLALKYGV